MKNSEEVLKKVIASLEILKKGLTEDTDIKTKGDIVPIVDDILDIAKGNV